MATKKVDINEFITKQLDIKAWEDKQVKTSKKRRLPNYVIFKDGYRARISDWLNALQRYISFLKVKGYTPNYVNVEVYKPTPKPQPKPEPVYYYPTTTFTQDVGSGCFGCTWYPNKAKKHAGVDVDRNDVGKPVRAIADGEIIYLSNNYQWDYGIGIKHKINGKTIYTINWHLEKPTVKKGQKVKAGQKLGVIGRVDPGQYTGVAHLHFGVSKSFSTKGALYPSEFPGTFIEPFAFLKKIGAKK